MRHTVDRGRAEQAGDAEPRALRGVHERVVQCVRQRDRHLAHGERVGRENVELICRNEWNRVDRDALRRRRPGDGQQHDGEGDDAARHETPRSVGIP